MIYQILIDRFNGGWTAPPKNENAFLGGTLLGIRDKLDYIKSLGATYIWLSPFFKTDAYHGYHITDYEEIDPHFGTWHDLNELINSAHDKGIRVIADFVPNHCHYNHPFFQDAIRNPSTSIYRDWFYFKDKKSSDCLHFCDYPELQKFNLENPTVANYFLKVGEKLSNIGIDGFRIDHALGIPFSFLRLFRNRMHELNPQTIVIGEVWAWNISHRFFYTLRFRSFWKKCYYWMFGFDQEQVQMDYYDSLDAVLDFEFRNILLSEIKEGKRLVNNERLKRKIEKHFSRYSSIDFQVIPFLDNHDTDRFLFNCDGDCSLLKEAEKILKESGKLFSYYYGTECNMNNKSTIFNAEPYADLRVREPMAW